MADPLDNQLRSQIQRSVASTEDAASTLNQLGPSLRQARRRRQIGVGVARLAGVLLIAGAGVFALDSRPADDRTTVVATAPTESLPGLPSPDDDAAAPTTSFRPSRSDPSATTSEEADSSSPSTAATSTPSTTAPTSTVPTTSTGDGSSTTAALPTGNETIDSTCGSIEVSVEGSDLSLAGVDADPGYEIDVKEQGPEKIEVSLEGPSGHCEFRAEIRDGALWSEVDEE